MTYTVLELELRPVDVLRFRTPRPFKVGGYAESEVLPPPGTVALAIASKLYFNGLVAGRDFESLLEELRRHVVFHGPVVASGEEVYVPCPLDLAKCAYCNKVFLSRWERAPNEALETAWPIHSECGRVGRPLDNCLLSLSEVARRRGLSEFKVVSLDDVFVRELRPGLFIDEATKSARPGFYYQVEWVGIRPGFTLREFVTIKDPKWADHLKELKMIRLGGKGQHVEVASVSERSLHEHYRRITGRDFSEVVREVVDGRELEIVTLTHTIFLDEGTGKCVSRPAEPPGMKLVGVASGKPKLVSGWEAAHGRPRPMYAAVPAGSVYRFAFDEGSRGAVERFVEAVICENLGHWSAIGYGSAIVIPSARGSQ